MQWKCCSLFEHLPKSKKDLTNEHYITEFQLAAFSSLYPLGTNVQSGLGLSHTIGYALGSPYGIPHPITSCITLAGVVKLKANNSSAEAKQVPRALPFTGKGSRTGNDREDAMQAGDAMQVGDAMQAGDAMQVGNAIEELVDSLGLDTKLSEYQVGEDQIPKVAKAAAKSDSGELHDGVVKLLRSKL
ncbi:hypothetical protein GJ744_011949 [Endocarpon pusillum]|uniref:Fe-containing alcohol dehydrogenase-like C-terminal domain-containing protein n=1 Tax=Endocarpon pusillum TaxID=364733 RepID=A0A8H7EAL9_9EURO|nr:hypothetical protein GJ744_011949 [Endocarpon pusillum]